MMAVIIWFILCVLMARVAVGFYLTKHDADYVDDNYVVRKLIEWYNKIVNKKTISKKK